MVSGVRSQNSLTDVQTGYTRTNWSNRLALFRDNSLIIIIIGKIGYVLELIPFIIT